MSRKPVLTLAGRRENTARRVQWALHWAAIAAQQDLHRQGLLLTSKHRAEGSDPTVAPQYDRFLPPAVRTAKARRTAAVAAVVSHGTSLHPDGAGKYTARCSCSWASRPLTEAGAKGQATRHVKTAADGAATVVKVAA